MTPYDLVIWGCAILVASVPVALATALVGAVIVSLRSEWRKRR